jgi:TrmH family RNA methyltransferase
MTREPDDPMTKSMRRITSRQNPLVARFRAVWKGDDRTGMLLDGAHLVSEALDAPLAIEHAIVASAALDQPHIAALVERLRRAGVDIVSAPATVMGAVSPVRTPSPIVAIAPRPNGTRQRANEQAVPFIAVAYDVQDPGNLGAIARVAEAAGATALIAGGQSADPYGWKTLRGSMGSVLRLPILVERDEAALVESLRRRRCRIAATAPRDGTPVYEADLRGPLAILVGGEGGGLPPSILASADLRVSIPMTPPVESLNTAVAAAVLLYEARRQRRV